MTSIARSKFPIAPTARSLALAVFSFFLLLAAAILVIPYFHLDNDHARLTSLEQRLGALRTAADLYYHQHGHRYPGEYWLDGKTRLTRGRETEAARAFVAQLTGYTNAAGKVAPRKSAEFRYGPYLDSLPSNPLMKGDAARAIDMDFTMSDPNAVYPADGRSGWRYYLNTGRLVANDSAVLADGTETANQ